MGKVTAPLHLDAKYTCGNANPRPAVDYELYPVWPLTFQNTSSK